jgi:hypothetical protein
MRKSNFESFLFYECIYIINTQVLLKNDDITIIINLVNKFKQKELSPEWAALERNVAAVGKNKKSKERWRWAARIVRNLRVASCNRGKKSYRGGEYLVKLPGRVG